MRTAPRFPLRPVAVATLALLCSAGLAVHSGCSSGPLPKSAAFSFPADETAFIDELQAKTFDYFWQECDPTTGLAPDRAPDPDLRPGPNRSFASLAATGFALTVYPVGVERGYVPREQAAERVLKTLRFLRDAPQSDDPVNATGYQGFYYHFVHMDTGLRFDQVELSTVDTALLLAGALFCQSYFDGATADEDSIRTIAEDLYLRADWRWASPRPPLIGHGWDPENGQLPYDWGGYNEAMLVYLLALASPTHPVEIEAWEAWTRSYRLEMFEGREQICFAPLFGHQYTHTWIDLRGIRDEFCRTHDLDYFENSRRAVLSQRDYALRNPAGWRGYGERLWGLTACDGPVHGRFEIDGVERSFETYWARGATAGVIHDDGTISPTAAAASIAFAPEVVVPVLQAMHQDHGEHLIGRYGFLDALNPTFTIDVPVQHGRVVPGVGWYDTDYLGIDQGPIVAMIENLRTGLVWNTLRTNPHIVRGLRRAGFAGGWLDEAEEVGP